jgi:thymidylate synthase
MNKLDTDYNNLLKDILENGTKKQTRNGEVISVFGRQIHHKMSDGFPLLTCKKVPFKTITTELLWFLNGRTDLRWLLERGNTIWVGDAYKQYSTYVTEEWDMGGINELFEDGLLIEVEEDHDYACESKQINYRKLTQDEFINRIKTDDEFAKKWGELGPIYGTQWRKWRNYNYIIEGGEIFNDLKKGFNTDKEDIERDILYEDQITKLIHNLKNNPDDRGLIVSAWNVGDLDNMVLRPCHNFFQVCTRKLTARERIALKSNGSTRLYDSIKEENYLTIDADDEIHKVCDKYNVPTRAISLMWNQRSVDTPLGLPFNIASYGLLLEIIAKIVNMVPDELIGNLGDTHIYANQIDSVKEQIGRDLTDEERYNIWFKNNYETGMEKYFNPEKLPDFDNEYYEPTPKRTREPFPLPTLRINTESWPTKTQECGVGEFTDNIDFLIKEMRIEDFQIENYQSHPKIYFPLSN